MALKKILLIILAFLSLALGAIGIFLPILPTTPFVLVAAACFASSSPRLYNWLSGNKYFGEFIENYRTKSGVKKTVKRNALIFLWATLLISALVFRHLHLWIILAVVGVCVTAHLLLMKTKIDEEDKDE